MATAVILLSILCGLLLAWFVVSVTWRTRRLACRPGVFRCNFRVAPEQSVEKKARWSGRRLFAEWVHDVLLIHRGVLVPRSTALSVRFPEGVVEPADVEGVPGHFDATLNLRLDDGTIVQLAARIEDRDLLAGPFLTVAALASGFGSLD